MTALPSASYSITVRLEVPAGGTSVSRLASAVEEAGGVVTALDVTASGHDRLGLDVTCAARDSAHAERLVELMAAVPGVSVGKVSDRTFLMHLGGKIEMAAKHPIRNRDDLSMIYTPGVARVCLAIADRPEDARRLTVKRNSIAVVTDGSAVLGLGNIGPAAALPVMEGKAALFKRFGDIDAWPLCLDTQDVDEIVAVVRAVAPGFAGINLEDISAPRCFEVEERLREALDIPVFHDDQHGTAIVVLAALLNALRVVGKDLDAVRIVMSGAGAAGTAIIKLLLAAGATDIVVADIDGVVHRDRPGITGQLAWLAEHTNPGGRTGSLTAAVAGADVFIGVSAPGVLSEAAVASMAAGAIVFALANPEPEIDPAVANRYAAVVATGRSDFPNQINNVLAFPGVFRGLLDARSHDITEPMLLAAARALAGVVGDDELNAAYITPSVFHPEVHARVAAAVAEAALAGHHERDEFSSVGRSMVLIDSTKETAMTQKIVPNIWCNGNAEEVANFYLSAFPEAKEISRAHYPTEGLADFQQSMAGQVLVIEFSLGGFRFVAINAGPEFSPTPMLSFMLNFDPSVDPQAREHLDGLWAKLSDGGEALMELGEYPFSPHYGWVRDKYGVTWQLILTNPEGEPRPFVIPALMFANANTNRAEEAARFYAATFEDGRLGSLARYPEAQGEVAEGAVMFGEFAVGDEWFAVMDSPVRHGFEFNEGISLQVDCADQEEIDRLWAALSTVPEAEQCGWCKDQFGVSWQVVPTGMDQLDAGSFAAMMQMKKIIIADLHP